MGTAERRERGREHVRTLILEAARDLLSEHGLGALSMRAIAERIEYSPGTIYLYFKDKDELIAEVVKQGFERLSAYAAAELAALPETRRAAEQYGAMGRAYARFGIENTAYFRVMFELPGVAQVECPEPCGDGSHEMEFDAVVDTIRKAAEEGSFGIRDPRRVALIGWGLIHGLVSLHLSGHLAHEIRSHEEFLTLIEEAMRSMYTGWRPAAARAED